jgi:hypothetical protein
MYDLDLYRGPEGAPPSFFMAQSRSAEVHQILVSARDGPDVIAAMLETVADAFPRFFDHEIRPMLQGIVDQLEGQTRPRAE